MQRLRLKSTQAHIRNKLPGPLLGGPGFLVPGGTAVVGGGLGSTGLETSELRPH